MLKRLALAIATLAISALALAQGISAQIIPPTVVIAPHLQDLGSENFTVGRELSDNGTYVATSVSLSLIQDAKGKLTGNATFSSSKPVAGQPAISLPITIPVKGKISGKAKSPAHRLDLAVFLYEGTPVTYNGSTYTIATPDEEPVTAKLLDPVYRVNGQSFVDITETSALVLPAGTYLLGNLEMKETVVLQAPTTVTPISSMSVEVADPFSYFCTNEGAPAAYTYVLKGKLKVAGGADFHSRTVVLTITGTMKEDDNAPIQLNEGDNGQSQIAYVSTVKATGLGFAYNYSLTHKIPGRNWFGIKPLADTAGYKKLTNANQGYFEIGYPGAYEVVVGTVTNGSDENKVNFGFKGKTAQGNLTFNYLLSEENGLEVSVPNYYIKTKSGVENIISNALNYTFTQFYIIPEGPL